MKINPTPGRVVYYKANATDPDGVPDRDAPLAAHIAAVNEDGSVNLMVISRLGHPFQRTGVKFANEGFKPEPGQCFWMPYQLGQAEKTTGILENLGKHIEKGIEDFVAREKAKYEKKVAAVADDVKADVADVKDKVEGATAAAAAAAGTVEQAADAATQRADVLAQLMGFGVDPTGLDELTLADLKAELVELQERKADADTKAAAGNSVQEGAKTGDGATNASPAGAEGAGSAASPGTVTTSAAVGNTTTTGPGT